MTDFKWRHFQGDVILWAVRWYCRYPISYRDLEEMLAERGISVDHTTIYRWVQCYAPEMESGCAGSGGVAFDPSWRPDETYVKVRGKWTYLYRAVDKRGDTIDFYLSPTRSAKAAKRFWQGPARPEALGKACHAQYRQSAELWCSDHRIEARRKAGPGDGPPAGEVSQ
ncbi:IS6 family transposase [Enterobacter cloacae]|uniref:IS6 family transposase n=1 Tax=Enterobacter cloacae TaxID=550 RepID=UPI00388EAA4E